MMSMISIVLFLLQKGSEGEAHTHTPFGETVHTIPVSIFPGAQFTPFSLYIALANDDDQDYDDDIDDET